jgi:hypothetical protein
VHQRGELLGQRPLRRPGRRPLDALGHQRLDLLGRALGEQRSQVRASASSALSQNWKKAYGEVSDGSSQTPALVLPNFVPSALVTSGVASACTRALGPAHQVDAGGEVAPLVEPPVCSVHPCRRYSSRKSLACRIW